MWRPLIQLPHRRYLMDKQLNKPKKGNHCETSSERSKLCACVRSSEAFRMPLWVCFPATFGTRWLINLVLSSKGIPPWHTSGCLLLQSKLAEMESNRESGLLIYVTHHSGKGKFCKGGQLWKWDHKMLNLKVAILACSSQTCLSLIYH